MNEKNESFTAAAQLSDRPRAKGHRETCVCMLCRRIQAAIAAGKPPKAVARALAHQRRLETRATPRNLRERRIAKDAMLTGAIAGQAASGTRPNIAQAARIAGMDPSQAAKAVKANDSILDALSRIGINADKLAEVFAGGLEACEVRLVIRNGEVVDALAVPDWHARHKFARDVLLARGELGSDRDQQPQGGGLIIITPDSAKVIDGHPAACACDACNAAWEEKAEHLRRASLKESAIDVTSAPEQPVEPVEEVDDWSDKIDVTPKPGPKLRPLAKPPTEEVEPEEEDDWTNYHPPDK
jgi:hypothetical protein